MNTAIDIVAMVIMLSTELHCTGAHCSDNLTTKNYKQREVWFYLNNTHVRFRAVTIDRDLSDTLHPLLYSISNVRNDCTRTQTLTVDNTSTAKMGQTANTMMWSDDECRAQSKSLMPSIANTMTWSDDECRALSKSLIPSLSSTLTF